MKLHDTVICVQLKLGGPQIVFSRPGENGCGIQNGGGLFFINYGAVMVQREYMLLFMSCIQKLEQL